MKAIKLPYPPKELSPNARVHWGRKHSAAKVYKQECFVAFHGVKVIGNAPIRLHLDFYPRTKHATDDDNLVAAFKAGRDGIAAALGIDDSRFKVFPRVMDETGPYVMAWLS